MEDIEDEVFCRICYSETNPITNRKDLISPCECSGSVKHVHYTCLKMWRMKGKSFGDMKICEQCKGKYKIQGEKSVYSVLISLSTMVTIFLVYCLSAAIFKSFCLAITSVVEELAYVIIYDRITIYQGGYRDYHLSCCLLFLSFYHVFTKPKTLLILFYLISYACTTLYELAIAKIIFLVMSLYIFREMYLDTYDLLDGIYYYILNMNWEKSQML